MRKKIILATQSRARRQLLKQLGLKFRTAVPAVKESRKLKNGCAHLVIENALKKAKNVAKRHKSGVVISADTVVLTGKRIIGKPKNKRDAVRNLKLLSNTTHWVYTGLAVIDIDKETIVTGYDKTKIHMRRLSEKEIKGYIRKARPLDKAGSFDIQGLGGMFIDRIEGCYYNVVGLPLAKLAILLQSIGCDII